MPDKFSPLEGLGHLAPMIMAGLGKSPQALQAVYQRQEALEEERRKENLSRFGREIFGMGDPAKLTPELMAATAKKYDVSPQDAITMASNFMQYKRAMRGDQVPMSVPMPDGRVRQAGVYESQIPEFMAANPGAMQGTITGQKENRYGPMQVSAGDLLPKGTVFSTDSYGKPSVLYAPPNQTDEQRQADELKNRIASLTLQGLQSASPQELKYAAGVPRPRAGSAPDPLGNAIKTAQLEKLLMENKALGLMSEAELKAKYGAKGGGDGGPREMTWANAIGQIEKNFSKMTPMGTFGVTADNAGKYQIALRKAQQLRSDSTDPLAVANEATHYANAIEQNYWRILSAAPTPDAKAAVKAEFRKQFGYEPMTPPM